MPYFSPVNCKDCKYERLYLHLCTGFAFTHRKNCAYTLEQNFLHIGAKTPLRANFASLTREILRPHEESQFWAQKGAFYFSS